jgi:hypothetical protein
MAAGASTSAVPMAKIQNSRLVWASIASPTRGGMDRSGPRQSRNLRFRTVLWIRAPCAPPVPGPRDLVAQPIITARSRTCPDNHGQVHGTGLKIG